MELNERKMNILKAIVKDYIETAEAVGSRTISKKHDLGVSAATIRNEMADLEELGYLVQPHTSAGRVPSEKGYKLYVDYLMMDGVISDNEKLLIEECVSKNVDHIKDLIEETSKLLSQLTNYTTVAKAQNLNKQSIIKHIQLVQLDNQILLVLVTADGEVKKAHIPSNTYLDQSKLNLISDNVTKKLSGKCITDLDEKLIAFIRHEIGEYSNLIDEFIDVVNFEKSNEEFLYSLNGVTNIFNYPEFSDVVKAKSFLNMVEKKETINKMINSKGIEKDNVNIIIGSDNDYELAKDCSIVTATYNINKDLVGQISFIGPTRMDYSRIYAIVNYMSLIFNKR